MLDYVVLRILQRLVGESRIKYPPLAGMFGLIGAAPSVMEACFSRSDLIIDPFFYISLCPVDVAVGFRRVEQEAIWAVAEHGPIYLVALPNPDVTVALESVVVRGPDGNLGQEWTWILG